MMKCIACGKPSIFSYRIRDVEAAFCPEHIPNRGRKVAVEIVCRH